MTDQANIYIGTDEALHAEIGLNAFYTGTWIVAVFRADGAEFEPVVCDTLEEAKEVIADYSAYLASLGEEVQVNWIH